jgi:hypothetical protein
VTLHIVLDDPANYFAVLEERVVVQVRRGPLTQAMLDVAERDLSPRMQRVSGPIGALAVINADAGPNAPEVQDRQRAVLGALLARPNALMVTVMLGDSVTAAMSRASGRLLFPGKQNIKHARTVEEGAGLIAAAVPGVTAAAIIESVRALQDRGAKA